MKTAITREGVYFLFIVLVILVGSVLREVNPMLLFASLLCAPLPLAWRLGRRSLKGLRIRRKMPMQVFAGEPFVVQLELTNPRRRGRFSIASWGLVVMDRIRLLRQGENGGDAEEKPYEPAVYFEYVANEESVRKTYAGRLTQRGRYRIGPIRCATRFPFGFFRSWFEEEAPRDAQSEFCVYPKLGKLASQWRTRHHETMESRQRHRFRPSRLAGEFLGIRRWQRGDAKKWIHWRSWARHQELVVRQFEQHRNRDCAVLLDVYRDESWTEARREDFELAVSFAATLVYESTRRGGSDLFFATSDSVDSDLAGAICLPLLETILHKLALVEPQGEDALVPLLLKAVSQVDTNAELILVTSGGLDPARSSRFAEMQNDPRYRAVLQRLRVVDTSQPDLDRIFTF